MEFKTGQVWVFKKRPNITILSVVKQGYVVAQSQSFHDSFPFLYSFKGFEETFIDACRGVQLKECTYLGTVILWDEGADLWSIPGVGEFEYLQEAKDYLDKI
jgi:hypothetical protein